MVGERYNYNWNVGHWGPGVSKKKTATVLVLLNLSLIIPYYSTLLCSTLCYFTSIHFMLNYSSLYYALILAYI